MFTYMPNYFLPCNFVLKTFLLFCRLKTGRHYDNGNNNQVVTFCGKSGNLDKLDNTMMSYLLFVFAQQLLTGLFYLNWRELQFTSIVCGKMLTYFDSKRLP